MSSQNLRVRLKTSMIRCTRIYPAGHGRVPRLWAQIDECQDKVDQMFFEDREAALDNTVSKLSCMDLETSDSGSDIISIQDATRMSPGLRSRSA